MAQIIERPHKDGTLTFQIKVSNGYDANGKRLKGYSMTWNAPKGMGVREAKKEVQRIALEFEDKCKKDTFASSNMTLSDFCDRYLETAEHTLARPTYDFYVQNIKEFVKPLLGHLKLSEIKPAHVQKYVDVLNSTVKKGTKADGVSTLSAATVKRYLTVLKSILKFAVKQQLIEESPAKSERLTLAKEVKPKIDFFTADEAIKMFELLENEPLQLQVIVHLGISLGTRPEEIIPLEFSDIDYDTGRITIERAAATVNKTEKELAECPKPKTKVIVKPTKDSEVRVVTTDKHCIELIKQLQAEKEAEAQRLGTQWHEHGWLFTRWNGELIGLDTPSRQLGDFLEANGMKRRTLKHLRHSSATLLLSGGVNVKQVQTRLGHADLETTNRYLHALAEADVEAANVLGDLLSGKKKEHTDGQNEDTDNSKKSHGDKP